MEHTDEHASLLPLEHPRSLSAADAADTTRSGARRIAYSSNDGSVGPASNSSEFGLTTSSRWKQAAHRVLRFQRWHDAIEEVVERHEPGAAPGIDPRRSKYLHLAAKWCLPVQITIADYDSKNVTLREGLDSVEQLEIFLSQPKDHPAGVRWIHVDGLNWEVIQALALKYDLHPLALEDTVHVPQRIKADIYDSCLYVSLIYLYLAHGGSHGDRRDHEGSGGGGPAGAPAASQPSRRLPRTISSARRAEEDAAVEAALAGVDAAAAAASRRDVECDGGGGAAASRPAQRRRVSNPGPTHYPLPLTRGSVALPSNLTGYAGGGVVGLRARSTGAKCGACGAASSVAAGLGGGGGPAGRDNRLIHVSAQQVSMFLLRGEHPNTLITIFQSDGSAVTEPILEQLREPRTLVREAEDASFLANLVIDTLVDHIFPVVGAYREQLHQYDQDVKAGGLPSAASTRELHAMQRDLRRIDRTIAPLQGVVSHMVTRDATAASHDALMAATGGGGGAGAGGGSPTPAFLSRLTRTYLGDVRDHVSTICEDLISLSAECGDLIGLIFNLTTLQQSQSTQTLAVVSTIFLPITFLAGVYGMNFDTLPELHWDYGYLYFWITSIAIVLVFMIAMLRAGNVVVVVAGLMGEGSWAVGIRRVELPRVSASIGARKW